MELYYMKFELARCEAGNQGYIQVTGRAASKG